MKRHFSFALTLAAALGFATVGWTQSGGGSGAGGASAGAAGTGGAATSPGAGTAGTAGPAGVAGTSTGVGRAGTAGPAGTAGTATGVGRPGVAGAAGVRGGVGAAGFNASGNVNQTPFFTDRGVRQQLNLNDNQFNTLNRAYQDAYTNYTRDLNSLNRNLTPQQRAAQMQNLENDFYNSFNRSLDTTFTDPQLRTRYDQLHRQYLGFNAFNNSAIQRQLNLTPQQQTQIRQLAAEWRRQLLQNGRGNGTDTNLSNITAQQWNALSTQFYDQLNAILTPQQQQTWLQLTGQRYSFPPGLYLNPAAAGGGNLGVNPPNSPNANGNVLRNRDTGANTTTRTGSTNNGAAASGTSTR